MKSYYQSEQLCCKRVYRNLDAERERDKPQQCDDLKNSK